MCLIALAWRPGHPQPLIVAANRDEFHARPSLPLAPWHEDSSVLAGRDLQAGGTWMGIRQGERFAALTNIRAPGQPDGTVSRGGLVAAFLRGTASPLEYLQQVAAERHCYAGFNLLVGDREQLCHLDSHEGRARVLEPGIHGVSNASLGTPWPKLVRICERLEQHLARASGLDVEVLLAMLADRQIPADSQLPNTGVSLARERQLGSIFVLGQDYGTRASTVLIRQADGSGCITERRFDAAGQGLGRVDLSFGTG